ncbi:MAG: Naphthalene 1,2-dioxygenase/salicylate 5-hydroxylase systems, ferredoxin component [Gemmatimonadaceae bacterium]|nr:Naphthalene 1,2-dioxygenase/salicylate 5-hydroxylase systems, ferredoxin component [Gemmatimonadaceae bacterium]
MIDLAAIDAIPDPGVLRVDAGGRAICLVRVGERVTAFVDECPHAGMSLAEGEILDRCELQCAWHGARFDVATGALRAGPAMRGLTSIVVRVADGRVIAETLAP